MYVFVKERECVCVFTSVGEGSQRNQAKAANPYLAIEAKNYIYVIFGVIFFYFNVNASNNNSTSIKWHLSCL